MSPTVPPISVITTSTSLDSAISRMRVLDLVGDVRDDLDGAAEVVAAALAPDHRGCRSPPAVTLESRDVFASVKRS